MPANQDIPQTIALCESRRGHAEDGRPEPGYEQSIAERAAPPDRGLVGGFLVHLQKGGRVTSHLLEYIHIDGFNMHQITPSALLVQCKGIVR
jgi:hypothetical protein